jgi:endonuclease/exonuclease/phosphatase family metal-dependent hydrolase
LPTLIVGDFNDWLNTLARGPFASHGFVQVTAPRSRFRSFPAYWPVASLDKAFIRGPCEIRHAPIVHSPMARYSSDHLPLVVDFHLNPTMTRLKPDRESAQNHFTASRSGDCSEVIIAPCIPHPP